MTRSKDTEKTLCDKACTCNAAPAAEPEEDGSSAGLYKLYDIGIEADGGHRRYDQKTAERFKRIKPFPWNAEAQTNGGDKRSKQEKHNKERENFCDFYAGAPGIFIFSRMTKGKRQCDGKDRKGSRELYDGCSVQRI